jgi:hypothetical protein
VRDDVLAQAFAEVWRHPLDWVAAGVTRWARARSTWPRPRCGSTSPSAPMVARMMCMGARLFWSARGAS